MIERASKPVADVKTGLAAASRRAKIPTVTAHVFRHTAATWMVMRGVPLWEMARFLGMSEATAERIYGKHAPDYLRRAAESLSEPVAPSKVLGNSG